MRPSMMCPQRNADVEDDTTMAAAAEGIGKMDLQDSFLTTPTDTGSVSEDDNNNDKVGGGGVGYWLLGGIIPLAKAVKEKAADIVAALGYGSDDEPGELGDGGAHERREQLRLPWEIRRYQHNVDDDPQDGAEQNHDMNHDDDGEDNEQSEPPNNVVVLYEEDLILKEKIHALSAKEDTFLKPFTAAEMGATNAQERSFLDKPRIELVNRIWQVDEQLRATHARLTGRRIVQETVFWRNYFHHCSETRKTHIQMYYQKQEIRDDEVDDDIDEEIDEDDESESSSSLVPANTDDEDEDDVDHDASSQLQESADDSSFIHVPSPPGSTGILSVDSMVFVDATD